ncbi:MAG TPA: 16S rRNA (uracil(1498)-N(3))-methyltransferase [Burkholderiaceae bacterium]|nr:16S rRNA (uracil(1498)-N(3))-methyltransferase [Burkholderiaceae bacterium]
MTPRFFVDAELTPNAELALSASVTHHAARVLRLEDGAAIRLFNGRGGEYAARLQLRHGFDAGAYVESFDAIERESPLAITLIQAMTSAEKLDWVVEKATELGVARVIVSGMTRSIARLSGERLARKLAHWRDVAIAACCQCGRNRLPRIEAAAALGDALALAGAAGLKLVLDLDAHGHWPHAINGPAVLVVGPEGGLTDEEVARARQCGFTDVQLGPRTLRTETAGLAAIAALQAIAGDLT